MVEKVKAFWEKAKEFLKKVPKKIYIALVVLLVAAAALVFWLNNRPYEVLFTELNTTEMSSILSYLEDNGVTEYKVENSDTILVPEHLEAQLKAKLLMDGYPQSGFAYTPTEGSGILATESERSAQAKRELEEKLSAVVRCFDGVREGVVTINPGEDLSFVLDSNRMVKATASVFVTMNQGAKLTTEQAAAIRSLVAHSVKGLEIDSVEIADSAGNRYSTGEVAADSEASALKLQLEEEWENKIRTDVLRVLVPWYGDKNVVVSVSCTVDVSQTVEDSTDVYLPEWAQDGSTNGRGIVGSRIYNIIIERDGEEPAGGTVGTSTNSDFPEYAEDLPELTGDENLVDISGQVDYNNSHSKKHIIRTAGYLTNCMVSVTINATTAGTVNVQEISRHVARASGITGVYDEATGQEVFDDYISIVAQPFYVEPVVEPTEPEPVVEPWILYAGIAGGALFLLLLIIILVVRRKRKKKKLAAEKAAMEAQDISAFLEAAAAARQDGQDAGANVMSIQSERSVELRQEIRKFAEENPEIAAQMVRGWLRGEEDNG